MKINVTRVKTLKSIRGRSVTITGKCWTSRKELTRLIRRRGGRITPNNTVTSSTNVFVRGVSGQWKYKTFGRKEEKVAQLIRDGEPIIVVTASEFQKLIEEDKPARTESTIAGQPREWLDTPPKRVFDDITKISGGLDREYTTNGRLEQGYLRTQLFDGKSVSDCAICGREFPVELLIAAHIKPRSECTLKERRDASNIVMPLCLFGCDSLYERGIISVDHKGCIVVELTIKMTKSVKQYLKIIKGKRSEYWATKNALYFQWHYEWRFRQ